MKKPIAILMTAIIIILSIATSALPLPACAATDTDDQAQGSDGAPSEDDASSMKFTLNAGEYEITKDENDLDVIQMEGFSLAVSHGDPMLPHKVYNIIVPPDVLWSTQQLKIISVETRILDGTYEIKPAPPPLPGTGSTRIGDWRNDRNANVYEVDANFPENSVELLPYSQMRKWKFTKVDFTPFQYNPVSKELTLTESVVIEISYSQSRAELGETLMADTVMDDIAAQIFLNYGEARGWYELEKPIQPQQTYDYVIITTNAIEAGSTKLSSFITHKQNLGHSVLVVTEDDFGGLTGQAPNHRAEKIRQWLINNYAAMGIEYVLLIGDPHPYESGEGDIPMKMCHPERNQVEYDCEQTPTDYFYADLTGNWDKDGDQYYGEWLHDYPVTGGVDFTPEVYVGRIPVYGADYTTLDNILQKIIDYETEPEASEAPGDISWRESILMPMGFQVPDPNYDGAVLAEQMKDDYLDSAGFSSWRMYQQGNGACGLDSSYTSEEELRGYPNTPNVRNRWSSTDFGIVAWWGHGNPTQTVVGYTYEGYPCTDGILLQSADCSVLDDDHPAFTYQCSCTNGHPETSNNLQYAILKQGGIATVSATRVSWFTRVPYGDFDGSLTNAGIGYEYVDRLVQGLPGGQALYQAKQSMTPNHQCWLMNWYDFNLYGDPETSIESAGAQTEPNIWVEPPSFDVTLPPGTTWNGNMKIGNDGDATLIYSMTDVETTGGLCFKWVAQDPDPLPAGESGIIEAKVHDPDGLGDIDYLKIWVTQSPFVWTYMHDDGVAPDKTPGDGIYTCAVYGYTGYGEEYGMLLEAKDLAGNTGHTSFEFHVDISKGAAAEGMLALNHGSEEGSTSPNPVESTGLNGQDNEITNTVETSAVTESGPTITEPTTTTLPVSTPEIYLKADAGSIDVLLVAADYETSVAEVQTYLLSFPDITTVDIFDAQYDTPTLSELQGYDAVLVWSNYQFYDPVALGDVLADYVDVGGGVVLASFCFAGPSWPGVYLEGRIITGSYSPFVQEADTLFSWANLGWYNPGHPIMTGVSSISGYFRDDVSLTSGANLIAEWDDDHLFVAEKGPVVGVALFPGVAGDDWTGDVPTLIHNSLIWSAEPPDCPWLDENPKTGDVEPGNYDGITVSIDTTGLVQGDYCAEIIIANNDPDENPTIVPVQLTVKAPIEVGKVLFDESHSPAGGFTIENRFEDWAELLRSWGFTVESVTSGPITYDLLKDYCVVVIPDPTVDYTEDEIAAIKQYVSYGGGLLILGEYGSYAQSHGIFPVVNNLSAPFGMSFNDDMVYDAVHNDGYSWWPLIPNFDSSVAGADVGEVVEYATCSIGAAGSAFPIAWTYGTAYTDVADMADALRDASGAGIEAVEGLPKEAGSGAPSDYGEESGIVAGKKIGTALTMADSSDSDYVDGFNVDETVNDGLSYGVQWFALNYTPGISYSLKKVELIAGEGTGKVIIQLRPDDGGKPSTTVLREASFNQVDPVSWQGAEFGTSYPLTAGTTYWIVFRVIVNSQASIATSGDLITYVASSDGITWGNYYSHCWMAKFYGDQIPVMAASLYGDGRAMVIGDGNLFDNGDHDGDGTISLYEYDNEKLSVNIIDWLCQMRKPDLVIEEKWEAPAPPKMYLHPTKPIDPREPIKEPVCTYWHELYPEYCNEYHLSDWDDNGDKVLSPCDNIILTDKTGKKAKYHVDEMTVTIFVALEEGGKPIALEFTGGYEVVRRAIDDPVCTYWHEVHPVFCPEYHITKWDDTGERGLSYCDWIYLVDLETGEGKLYHVEEVTWDIIVSPLVPADNTYTVSYTIHNQGNATAPAGHSSTLYVDGNVIEHKVAPVDLKPSQTYTDTFRTVVECTAPEDKITVCADDYDVTDEWDERNNCLSNVWQCPEKPDLVITEKWVNWPECHEPGINCTICYNVTNIGNGTAPKYHNTTLYVDGAEVAHDHVPEYLVLGENYTGCFDDYTWEYTPPSDNITVCADNDNTVNESNETNNCMTNIWMCGDVNEDGRVTMSDVRKVYNRYLDPGYPLDLPWAADVNCDGRITMSDVRKVYNRYLDPSYDLNCCCEQVIE